MNKHKASKNPQISTIVKRLIKNWKDEVGKQKRSKLVNSAGNNNNSATASTTASTAASVSASANSTTNSNSNDATSSSTQQTKFVSKGPRNAINDGVKVEVYSNKTRNGAVSALYNGLCIDSEHPVKVILEIAKQIEIEVFNSEKLDTVNSKYTQRLRTLTSNLRQKNNPELRRKINNGDITAKEFVNMSPKEMAPESLKKELEEIKKKNLFNAQGATQERAVTDRFTCGKCKEKKVSYYQLQTRSADEPLTTFCTCENCGNRWKFS